MNQEQFKKTVDCVVSNSINYKTKSLLCDESVLQTLVFSYANNECKGIDDVANIYKTSLRTMKERKKAIGCVPVWVPFVYVLGFMLLALEVYTIIRFGYNIVFLFFIALAISLMGTGKLYVRSTENERKAINEWKKSLIKGNADEMLVAFRGIAKVFS